MAMDAMARAMPSLVDLPHESQPSSGVAPRRAPDAGSAARRAVSLARARQNRLVEHHRARAEFRRARHDAISAR